jgi:hypothetical protein
MTKEEWKKVLLAGFAASGWAYAIMLTRKEVFDVWQSVPWWEMLLESLIVFFVLTPLAIWVRVHFWGRPGKKGGSELPSPAAEDT